MPSSLDLYLYSVHEIPVWAPLVGPLRARAIGVRFVVEPPGRNVARGSTPDPARGWVDVKDERVVDLVDAATEASLLRELAAIGEKPLRRRRLGASAGTTQGTWFVGWYPGALVRCMYGVGFVTDAYGHGPVNAGFDLVLAHGPFSASEISTHVPDARVAVVGFPKWAAYRRGELSREEARRRLLAPPDPRPLLAWLPTWAHNSSLADAAVVVALAEDFHVVMKPHHNTAKFEQARLSGLADGITVLPPTASLVDLLVAADVVVGDLRSGGFTEGLLADRPVIGLARPGSDWRATLHPGAAEAADVCADPAELPALARRAVADDPHAGGRRRWVPELFGDTGGADDELAADAVAEAVRRGSASAAQHVMAVGREVRHRGARVIRR